MLTRNQARAQREAEAAAASEAESQQQQQQEGKETPEKSVSAKAARTMSYADPLEHGASPVRGPGAGARRLGQAIHLAGVGTRWGY